jgi:hypothetical protein
LYRPPIFLPSSPEAIPDSDRAKRRPLAEPDATDSGLNPGDLVEGDEYADAFHAVAGLTRYPDWGENQWDSTALPIPVGNRANSLEGFWDDEIEVTGNKCQA